MDRSESIWTLKTDAKKKWPRSCYGLLAVFTESSFSANARKPVELLTDLKLNFYSHLMGTELARLAQDRAGWHKLKGGNQPSPL